jgi:hypothetical protein
MKNSDLFDLIKSFSNEEIKSFDKFLLSPYFVSGISLNKVFREIIRNKNLFLDCDYKKLNEKLFKRLKYSRFTLNKQLSYLSKEVLKYLKLKAFEADNISAELIFNEYLLKKKSFTALENNLKKTTSLIDCDSGISDRTFLDSFKHNSVSYDRTFYNLVVNYKNVRENKISLLDNAMFDILLYSYMETALIYVNYNLLFLGVNNNKEMDLLSEINLFFSQFNKILLFEKSNRHKIIFTLYKSMYIVFFTKKKNDYFVYKKSVKENLHIFNIRMINLHFKVLIQFCILKDRLGQEKEFYKKECLNLLIEYFENNYFKIDGIEYVTRIEFRSFIGRAYAAKEFEMIKNFIENISFKLKPSDYEDMVNFGYAYYYLGIKEYRKALKNINSISDYSSIIKFDLRNIELRIYYELGKIETLIDAIHNYRTIILKNDELTKSDKNDLLKLLKYLNILININNKTNIREQIFEAGYYKKKIDNESHFALKNWLMEKFENIEKDITTRKNIKAKVNN